MYNPNDLAAAERALEAARRKEAAVRTQSERTARELASRAYMTRLEMEIEVLGEMRAALTSSQPTGNPKAEWEAAIAAEVATGKSRYQAILAVMLAKPELAERYRRQPRRQKG